jgi:hypothetical protein
VEKFFISAFCRFWLPFLVTASRCRFWLPLLVAVLQKRIARNILFAGDRTFWGETQTEG